jgi:hypothetical protein
MYGESTAAHPDAIARWDAFSREPHRPLPDEVKDALVPLHGTPEFVELSEAEKRRLYLYFIQWVAEFLIVLEGLLAIAFRKLPGNAKAARILGEEFLHGRAFRRFLRNEKVLGYPARRVFLKRQPLAQRVLTAIFRRFPLAMAIPGAKIEAFSISYSKLLKNAMGDPQACTWSKLNWLHLMDEALHVPHEFELYNEEFDRHGWSGRLGTVAGTWIFFAFLQWMLIRGCFRMAWTSLEPSSGFWRRLSLSWKTLLWASYVFPPSRYMRTSTQSHYRERKPRWGRLIRFVLR